MASLKSIKLSNRSPKTPIKKLPSSVDVTDATTVEDLKKIIAKQAGISDYNRVGIFDPTTKKTLKNRKARLVDEPVVAAAGEVLVKDLGLQMDWRTVYVIEYLGPLMIHALAVYTRPYLYKDGGSTDMSFSQWLAFGMIMAHFVKREIETLFVHKFSANTMPFRNIFKNCGHYWILSGFFIAYFVYAPSSLSAVDNHPAINAVGTAIYLFGEINNALVHTYLSSLRSTGGTERKIPVGYSFKLVTCPNYMFEVIAWLGVIIVTRSWAVAFFLIAGTAQMYSWARGKEHAYRKEFGDSYKKKRFVILPGLM
ncbi:3-oxo-5-alpha-steroid 4-dehydrogenase-domain-containing protein [Stachybotrys elegans]|uniref:very-long-chain enoyl-CoA reductase n=1 Tax=Stachybotrys elegans TaxID=80388 RepID=A0A8K0SS43_9HYPO|nr:3-oxo-5-alpha-steroid 4-dehydrogenase-domain-containing protein [Stachybotrys elegans]